MLLLNVVVKDSDDTIFNSSFNASGPIQQQVATCCSRRYCNSSMVDNRRRMSSVNSGILSFGNRYVDRLHRSKKKL